MFLAGIYLLVLESLLPSGPVDGPGAEQRLRVLIETDAGGDPDDEQSLVRFLLYTNEWDVEGIIANRPRTRDGENLNPERTGLGVVRRLVRAYGECYAHLALHDPRYPEPDVLLERTVAGYDDTDDGVNLIVAAVDRPDPRPIWYCDWGTDRGAATVNMKRALDRVLNERGPEAYARFKAKLRLVSYDQFGDHTTKIDPPFPLWVNTFQPPLEGKRWYHRFSALTATAGGFDLERDVRNGHGPLGAMYPTNTTHVQKEGDTMTFLYLVPTGMNDPDQPAWGSWAGRYGLNEAFPNRSYFWANQADTWNGSTHRDHTLARWAAHLQNDFRARTAWCVHDFAGANHAPKPRITGPTVRTAIANDTVTLDASDSTDPDGHRLSFAWSFYPEAGTFQRPFPELHSTGAKTTFVAPRVNEPQTMHVILTATDNGSPPLTRYQRVIVTVMPANICLASYSYGGTLQSIFPRFANGYGKPVRIEVLSNPSTEHVLRLLNACHVFLDHAAVEFIQVRNAQTGSALSRRTVPRIARGGF